MLELHELPPSSWQRAYHEAGHRFPGPPAIRHEVKQMQQAHEASQIGKTVMQSFANGEQRRVTEHGTPAEKTEIITPAVDTTTIIC